jgi:hypothetical protein
MAPSIRAMPMFGDDLIGQTAAVEGPTVGGFCLVALVLQTERLIIMDVP